MPERPSKEHETLLPRSSAYAIIGLIALASVGAGYYRMLSGFAPYDDEGYLLMTLKSYMGRSALYDGFFSQYGPFYYEFFGEIFKTFNLTVSHDAGRLISLLIWVFSSLSIGLTTYRITRSTALGVIGQLVAFILLRVLANEPMHPVGLLSALLALWALLLCLMADPPRVAFLLGLVAAAIALTKINVGALMLVSLALVAVRCYGASRALKYLVVAVFISSPFALMYAKLNEIWAAEFATHVSFSALLVAIMAFFGTEVKERTSREVLVFLSGLIVGMFTICAVISLKGTAVSSLYEGIIGGPLRHPTNFVVPVLMSGKNLYANLLSGTILIGYLVLKRHFRGRVFKAFFSCLLVVLGSLGCAKLIVGSNIFGLLSFAWLALLDIDGTVEYGQETYVRVVIASLAVLQPLHAYPVAGSQKGPACLLLVLVWMICISNGMKPVLEFCRGDRRLVFASTLAAWCGVLVAAGALLGFPYQSWRHRYETESALNLDGAKDVRLDSGRVTLYQTLTEAVRKNCDRLISMPGLNSINLWSGIDPPTGFNGTGWMTIFSFDLQEKIVREIDGTTGLCLLRNDDIALFWLPGGNFPNRPLYRFLTNKFRRKIADIDGYALYRESG